MPSVDLPVIGRMFQADILKDEKSKNYTEDASKLFTLIKKLHFYIFVSLVSL